MALRPIFVFSLPRSGSTVVQRLLATHAAVSTTSEPWLLLPFLYLLRPRGVYGEYGHGLLSLAVEDFLKELPSGVEDYRTALHDFALRLYERAADASAQYFLDKTPRYHLIVDQIIRTFPEGKFVFVWRNPLAVVASMLQSWPGGKWNLYTFKIDLFEGLSRLTEAFRQHHATCCAVRYEDLVTAPQETSARLFGYLELDFTPDLLSRLAGVELRGRLGDTAGAREYDGLSAASLKKWEEVLGNPVRRTWCRRYLDWVGKERLAAMGYDLLQLQAELRALPFSLRFLGSDAVRSLYGLLYPLVEPRIFWHKLEKWRAHGRLYPHE